MCTMQAAEAVPGLSRKTAMHVCNTCVCQTRSEFMKIRMHADVPLHPRYTENAHTPQSAAVAASRHHYFQCKSLTKTACCKVFAAQYAHIMTACDASCVLCFLDVLYSDDAATHGGQMCK